MSASDYEYLKQRFDTDSDGRISYYEVRQFICYILIVWERDYAQE